MPDLSPDFSRVLVSEASIQARVADLAAEISHDYAGVGRILVVGVLRGAFIFTADLARRLTTPHAVDFMALSTYGKATRAGEVRIVMDLREPIENEHVLLVEDIVDGGHTLSYLLRLLGDRNPASLKTCVMVKKRRDSALARVDYLGFEIPDAWVVGYGLDYADRYRTLPYIAELKPDVYRK